MISFIGFMCKQYVVFSILSICSLKVASVNVKNCKKALMIKKNNIHVYILQQNPKSGYIRIQFMLLAVLISRV